MIRRIVTLAAALAAAGTLALTGMTGAGASTFTCTANPAATTATNPIGCGGLQSLFTAKGVQDISAAGNFNNASVVTALDSASNTKEDFTVFQVGGYQPVSPEPAGQGALGEFIAMFTPNGRIPGNAAGDFTHFTNHSLEFCLSVQNVSTSVGVRWFVVLRNCWISGATLTPAAGTTPGGVTNPNPYQVWEPTVGDTGLQMVNKALLSSSLRHGSGPNTDYVLDIRSFGGPGTQLIAYPGKSVSATNQEWSLLGCTEPASTLNGGSFTSCP